MTDEEKISIPVIKEKIDELTELHINNENKNPNKFR
jgi:hypothetical protein